MQRSPHESALTGSLADLLARAALGDEPAFARFYDDTAPRVYGLVLRVVRDPGLAERVTREVFLQAWINAHSYDDSRGTAASWLMVAAHRRAVDSVRVTEPQDPSYGDQAARPVAAALEDSDECLRTQAVLARLGPAEREAVELAYFGGYTHSEVASLVGADSGTGATLVRDGLLQLRGLLHEVA